MVSPLGLATLSTAMTAMTAVLPRSAPSQPLQTSSSLQQHPASRSSADAARLRLEAMFRKHHALVWRTLRRLGADPDAASDATQQAYLIAAERIEEIRSGSERAFLFSTAITLFRTKRRREQRCQLEDDMDTRSGRSETQEQLSRQQYARQLLDQLLSKLDPDLVTVFALFELEGLTTPEIAELLSIPLGTAASRLRRARDAFRLEAERLEQGSRGRQS